MAMKYRRLGKTGLRVSVIGIGTYQFGGSWGKDFTQREVDLIFEAARDQGVNLIDTAECYGDHLAESLVGGAIRRDRDRWIVATKFGHRRVAPLETEPAWSAQEVRRQLERSLRALRTDHIDLYQFHSGPNEAFDNEALWSMLERQVRHGKVRWLGLSLTRKSTEDRHYQLERAGLVGAGAIQVPYNRLESYAEERILPYCIEQDLGVIARVPLASGFLSGKYASDFAFAPTDTRAKKYTSERIREILAQVERIRGRELPEGVPLTSWALTWSLRHPAVACVIPGCKNSAQAAQNASAAGLDLVAADHPLALP